MKKVITTTAVVSILLFACQQKKEIVTLKKEVTPPLAGLETPFETFKINPEKGGTFKTREGSTIHIPSDAFAYENGKPVTGSVNISFREYHNALDMFLSGIPMEYDANGKQEHFESAGMFEIQAEQNNQKVYVANDKNIKVSLISYKPEKDYRFFKLNNQVDNWDYMGEADPIMNKSKLERIEKVKRLKEQVAVHESSNFFVFDYLSALDVFFPDNFWEVKRSKDTNQVMDKVKSYGLELLNISNYEPVRFNQREYVANMIVWENIGQKFPKNKTDLRSAEKEMIHIKGNIYEVNFYHRRNGNKLFSTYIKGYAPLKYLTSIPDDQWKNERSKLLKEINEEEKRLAFEADCFREFSINDMGIYNWDRFQKQEIWVKAKAKFEFPVQLDKLTSIKAYCMIPQTNSVIKFNNGNDVILGPADEAIIFAVLPNQELGVFSNNKYQQIPFSELQHKQEEVTLTFYFENRGKVTSKEILEKLMRPKA